MSDIPLAAATLQMTPIDWAYQTEPQEASCFGLINRRSRWPRGRVLGGSSVLNYMLYIRGNARDYDRWDQVFGAFGWSWADVFPYFLKSEDNRDPSIASNGKPFYVDKFFRHNSAVVRSLLLNFGLQSISASLLRIFCHLCVHFDFCLCKILFHKQTRDPLSEPSSRTRYFFNSS